ncbi:MAG: hypothetical protein HZB38_13995 [Planctomycetes bacterium]|nr:hypothetical protein [Planctomycetota bacterium]
MAMRTPTWLVGGRGLAAQAQALCRVVAPDAATGPFYVVLRPDLPAEYQGGEGGALALTSRHLDLMLRPTLERQRRWRGRGPTILLDPVAIAADAGHRPRPSRRRVFPAVAVGVVLHELAHIVITGPRDDEVEPDPALIQFGRLSLAADLTGTEAPTNGPGAAVPWRGHEWPFIRIALYLAYRAARLGLDVAARDVFDAREYELSPTHRYVLALGNEPEHVAGRPITKISQVPPPTEFVELWQADVRGWMSQHEITHELPMTLAACGRRISIPTAGQDAPVMQKGTESDVEGTVQRVGIAAQGS